MELNLTKSIDTTNYSSSKLYAKMNQLNKLLKFHSYDLNLLGTITDHNLTFETYNSYSQDLRKTIYTNFHSYADILMSALENTQEKTNQKQLLWTVLKKLGLNFGDDLFPSMSEEDIVEIYRYDGIQIFRNLNFHKVCSYQYPELFIIPWEKLFKRNPFFKKQILSSVAEALSGKKVKKYSLEHIKTHEMEEMSSPDRFKMDMELRFLYPLSNADNNVEYVIVVSNVELKTENKFNI